MPSGRLQRSDTGSADPPQERPHGDARDLGLRGARPDSSPVRRRLLSVREAGIYLSLSPWTIRDLCWSGQLAEVRIGRRVLIDQRDLDALVESTKRNRERI